MRIIVTSILLCLICAQIEAGPPPERGGLKGSVRDSSSHKPLRGVNITILGTRLGASSDRDGFFTLSNVLPGRYLIRISHIGYAIKRMHVEVPSGTTLDLGTIELQEEAILLKEIVISPGTYSVGGVEPSRQSLTSEDIEMMGFAEDITKAVQRVPGIIGDDFSAKFSIRGGDRDEVLFLLDGVQIYKPYHQKDFGGGLFSTIDIEAVQQVEVLTGGYTAEYGDRMSGVLNMSSKRPARGRESSAGISLTTVKAFTMAPFNDGKGAWLVSGRRGFLNVLNWLTKNEYKLGPAYYDAFGVVENRISSGQVLSATVFTAHDSYFLDEEELEPGITEPNIDHSDTRYGNHYGWVTLKSTFSDRLYTRSIGYAGLITQSRFWDNLDNDPKAHYSKARLSDDRDFILFGMKQDGSFDFSDNVLLRFGWNAKRLRSKYDYANDLQNEVYIPSGDSILLRASQFTHREVVDGNQLAFYLSTRVRVLDPLTFETGLRYDQLSYTGDKLWSPRVNLVYALSNKTFLRGGWGHFYQSQGIDDMKIQFEQTTFDKARKSQHYVAGLEHTFDNGLYARAETYHKEITRIPVRYFNLGADIDEFYPEARDDLVKVSVDKARTKGLELYLKRDTGGKVSFWFSYIWSLAEEKVTAVETIGPLDERLGTQSRPWDQRHSISIDINYRPTPGWHLNVAWQFRSGWPYTTFDAVPVRRADSSYAFFQDYSRFNSARYPAYHRLDMRINRYFHTSKGRLTVYLHVINLYNRKNISGYDFEGFIDENDNFRSVSDPEYFYGLLPYAGIAWDF